MPALDDVLTGLRTGRLRVTSVSLHPDDYVGLRAEFEHLSATVVTLHGVRVIIDSRLQPGEAAVGRVSGSDSTIHGNIINYVRTGRIGPAGAIGIITDDRSPIDPQTYVPSPEREWTRLPMPMPRTPVFGVDVSPLSWKKVEPKPKEPPREPKTLWELLEDSDDNDP